MTTLPIPCQLHLALTHLSKEGLGSSNGGDYCLVGKDYTLGVPCDGSQGQRRGSIHTYKMDTAPCLLIAPIQ